MNVELRGDAVVKTTSWAVALGATLLLPGSWRVAAQDALFTSERDCTADVLSLCERVMPGSGRVLGCLHMHVRELSVGCSTILSKASWTAKECADDIREFCPHAPFGNVSSCLQAHLGEASASCRSALAFMASPAASRN
jgi:hypothetical protein